MPGFKVWGIQMHFRGTIFLFFIKCSKQIFLGTTKFGLALTPKCPPWLRAWSPVKNLGCTEGMPKCFVLTLECSNTNLLCCAFINEVFIWLTVVRVVKNHTLHRASVCSFIIRLLYRLHRRGVPDPISPGLGVPGVVKFKKHTFSQPP